LAATARNPVKLIRFAHRVLHKPGQLVAPAEDVVELVKDVVEYLEKLKHKAALAEQLHLVPVEAGPGRTDAFGAGANAIFGPLSAKNIGPMTAPVRLPYLWGTGDFAWVQYESGIRLPLARNLIASIAAGATLSLLDEDGKLLPESERYET